MIALTAEEQIELERRLELCGSVEEVNKALAEDFGLGLTDEPNFIDAPPDEFGAYQEKAEGEEVWFDPGYVPSARKPPKLMRIARRLYVIMYWRPDDWRLGFKRSKIFAYARHINGVGVGERENLTGFDLHIGPLCLWRSFY